MNVLFVSIAFPPKSDPEALQAGRYFRYLREEPGLAIDVVTSRVPTLWMPVDPTLEKYAQGARQTIEVPIFEPRLLSVALAKFVPSVARTPDTRQTFFWRWRRVVRVLEHAPDVVYSRSFPLSSAVMGHRLSKHYRVPWVLHLSDPWAASPLIRYPGIAGIYNRRTEEKCFAAAAAVTLASSRIRDDCARRFPRFAHKLHVFPNVFDPADVVDARNRAPKKSERLRLVYTGSLQGTRSVRYLLRALEWCKEREPRLLDRLEVVLAGSVDRAERGLLDAAPPCVTHRGMLPFAEAMALQRSADLLLVIDSPLRPEESVFFPSKLLDYLAACRPVLAITSPGSMTRDVLGSSGACFDHDDAPGVGAHLLGLLRAASSNGTGAARSTTPDAHFSATENAHRLAELFRRVGRSAGHGP
jgi:glycosyltransferase involved in cell wall biosynthesis